MEQVMYAVVKTGHDSKGDWTQVVRVFFDPEIGNGDENEWFYAQAVSSTGGVESVKYGDFVERTKHKPWLLKLVNDKFKSAIKLRKQKMARNVGSVGNLSRSLLTTTLDLPFRK